MDCRITALRRISDGGHNVKKGATATVPKGYADEWVSRGWAERVGGSAPAKADEKASK